MKKSDQGKQKIWALVPAAGVGVRMAASKPKQYISVQGKTVLEHTLVTLLSAQDIDGVQLCLSPDDAYWSDVSLHHSRLLPVVGGGETRADSVLNGLKALAKHAKQDDWVLVHDAARPCLSQRLLSKLIAAVADHEVGGILAVPVSDTIKYVNGENNQIEKTVNRDRLWAAQTPQMFRFGLLKDCLDKALTQGIEVTDEASCVEAAGFLPVVVPSDRSNIKVTYAEDIDWVVHFLASKN